MARTRRHGLTAVFALILLSLTTYVHAAGAVLGLDVGTEYIKAALVKPGIPLEIVLTKDSRRKEAAALAFKPNTQDSSAYPERLYGADALALAPRFPGDVFPNLKPLLGSIADSAASYENYKLRYPSLDLSNQDGRVALRSNGLPKEKVPFTVEELLSMQIQSMKVNAENMAGKGSVIQDAVITVPAYYTVDERRAVQHAAELAGLRVMSLVSDGMAVGLNYATSRTFPNVDQGESPEYHLVYDMGAGSTTATIIQFQARNIKGFGKTNKTVQEVSVLGTGWDKTLGGDALNQLIMEDMIHKFIDSTAAKAAGVTADAVKGHGRAMAKLWKESERIRMVLSANTETSASFEGLFNDVDFRYKLSRSDYETMAATHGPRMIAPINAALAKAKLEVGDLNSVVLHGGVIRTPFIQRDLETVIGDASKLRSNVNADESAVFGAAFRAAGLSPSFRVKDIKTDDVANYGATLQWTADGKSRKQGIFVPTSSVGTVKKFPMKLQENFDMSITQHVDDEERLVSVTKVSNLTASFAELTKTYSCAKEDIKTVFSLRLDPVTGLPEVSSGTVSCEYDPSEKKEGVVGGVKNLFGWGSKADDQKPLGENDTAEDAGVVEETLEADTSSASSSTSTSASSSKSKETPKPKISKKKTATINLKLDVERKDSKVVAKDALKQINDRLGAFDKSDEQRRLREEAFNTLEGLTYRVRDLLTDDSILAVSSQSQRDAVDKVLSSTSDWLYGDGASAALDVVKEKLKDLKSLVDPITLRRDEVTKRPAALQSLEQALTSGSSVVKIVQESIDKAAEASSSAVSAASAAASAASSVVTEAASSILPGDDLEDEEPSSTSSTPAPTPTWDPSPFSDYDLTDISSLYEKTKKWLDEQKAAQDALSASDAPVLLSSELEKRAEQISQSVLRILQKQTRYGSGKTKSSSKSKAKPKKTKSSSSSTSTAASEGTPEPISLDIEIESEQPTATPSKHDEL